MFKSAAPYLLFSLVFLFLLHLSLYLGSRSDHHLLILKGYDKII